MLFHNLCLHRQLFLQVNGQAQVLIICGGIPLKRAFIVIRHHITTVSMFHILLLHITVCLHPLHLHLLLHLGLLYQSVGTRFLFVLFLVTFEFVKDVEVVYGPQLEQFLHLQWIYQLHGLSNAHTLTRLMDLIVPRRKKHIVITIQDDPVSRLWSLDWDQESGTFFSLFRCVFIIPCQIFTDNKHSQKTECTKSRY